MTAPAAPDSTPADTDLSASSELAHVAVPPARRIVFEDIYPEIDCGAWPAKREIGEVFEVWADILADGHEQVRAMLLWRADTGESGSVAMRMTGNDRWHGAFALTSNTRYRYEIAAWVDSYGSWAHDTALKHAAQQPVGLEIIEGESLIEQASARARGAAAKRLGGILAGLRGGEPSARLALMLDADTVELVGLLPDPAWVARSKILELTVDRERARFAAWYEMVPRSQGKRPGRSASFADCIARLPDIKAMGFDTVYLPPIHPIGETNRKGRNNATVVEPSDPGSFYAIGSRHGGHTAIEPGLGTLADFRALVAAADALGMEIALDFAVQASPDHPWIAEHPDWFRYRPDGSIKHAENPPKRYEDIVNVDFFSRDADALWHELRAVVLFWIAQGVKVFRVDNPHTKPIAFWAWLIRTVQTQHPEVIFLSEAFTRPKMMRLLAKAGFSQSYTYFTWRNSKAELTAYLTELSRDWSKDYLRPNFFTSTPDILPPILQTGGRPAFMVRLALAATLSPAYGIYNGFELCEAAALPGREEYANSEKYEFKVWDWDRPGNIKPFIAAINAIRRANPALRHLTNLRFHEADNDQILFYSKITPDRGNAVFVVVNLDPHHVQDAHIEMPLALLGLAPDRPYRLHDLLQGHSWLWTGARQHQQLVPERNPVAIFSVDTAEPTLFP
jgi:starch synthase (maltosyl-transferring)